LPRCHGQHGLCEVRGRLQEGFGLLRQFRDDSSSCIGIHRDHCRGFAGYQIAFAHKRLSDVAPVLVGGLLIGGAATIAGWFVGDWQAATHVGVANTC